MQAIIENYPTALLSSPPLNKYLKLPGVKDISESKQEIMQLLERNFEKSMQGNNQSNATTTTVDLTLDRVDYEFAKFCAERLERLSKQWSADVEIQRTYYNTEFICGENTIRFVPQKPGQ